MEGSVLAGYICMALSLLILPIVLGLAGFILGIVNASKNYALHGIIQIIFSVVFTIIGAYLGMLVT